MMPRPFLIFSQSDVLIQTVDTNTHTQWQTVQIQISWLLQKPTNLDLHCLQRQDISRFSRTRVKFDRKTPTCLQMARTFLRQFYSSELLSIAERHQETFLIQNRIRCFYCLPFFLLRFKQILIFIFVFFYDINCCASQKNWFRDTIFPGRCNLKAPYFSKTDILLSKKGLINWYIVVI